MPEVRKLQETTVEIQMGVQGEGRVDVRGTAPDPVTAINAKNRDTTLMSAQHRIAQRLHQQPTEASNR